MKVGEALKSLIRIKKVYDHHDYEISHIEYNILRRASLFIYSIKGTEKNAGRRGWIALARDIISDIRLLPVRNREMRSIQPAGFMRAGIAFANELSSNHKKIDRIQIEGHSLGGVVGLIAADILVKRGFCVVTALTIGAPKSGRLKALAKSDLEIVCLKHGKDIVTTLPPFYWQFKPAKFGKREDRIGDHSLDRSIESLNAMNPEDEL
jgi:hypothetical protein